MVEVDKVVVSEVVEVPPEVDMELVVVFVVVAVALVVVVLVASAVVVRSVVVVMLVLLLASVVFVASLAVDVLIRENIVAVMVSCVFGIAEDTESHIWYASESLMTVLEQRDKTQLRAASPSVKPLGVFVRQRHLVFEGDVHCVDVYSDLIKLSTQSFAQSGTMESNDESDTSLEVSAAAQTRSTRRTRGIL